MYQKRQYRELFRGVSLEFFDVCVLETDLRIGASKKLYAEALAAVKDCRRQLELYIGRNTEFLKSLEPIEAEAGAPDIIKKMCHAAKQAGVGPMAAVAGAISELVGIKLLEYSDEVIVENGGDIFIKTNIVRTVGVYAGSSPFTNKLGVEIVPEKTPGGICTSAGTVGHSLSFGKADAAIIMSGDTFLADAVATATGNIVKTADDIGRALDFALGIKGIEGVLVIVGDMVGVKGDLKLVNL